jgi:mandelate racemase
VGQERERRAGASGPDQRRGDPTAPLVLIDLETEEGPIGRSYVFSYTPLALEPLRRLAEDLGTALRGDAVAPLEIERKLQGMFRLLGPQGLTGIAASGIDMAAWDALARANGLPWQSLRDFRSAATSSPR